MRYTKLAAAAAVLSLGIMSVAAFTPHPRQPEAAQRAAATTPEPALETFYVPAQHVNAASLGAPIEEPVTEFY
jgi:hypothetical protein